MNYGFGYAVRKQGYAKTLLGQPSKGTVLQTSSFCHRISAFHYRELLLLQLEQTEIT